jgi:hypothetical protein
MKGLALILALAVAIPVGLGTMSRAARTTASESTPQKITVLYGDVPVTLSADSFQMPFDPSLLTH